MKNYEIVKFIAVCLVLNSQCAQESSVKRIKLEEAPEAIKQDAVLKGHPHHPKNIARYLVSGQTDPSAHEVFRNSLFPPPLSIKSKNAKMIENLVPKILHPEKIRSVLIVDSKLAKFNWAVFKPFVNIKKLVLENCQLTEVPEQIEQLVKLQILNLSENDLSGASNWHLLPKSLEELDLADTRIDAVPEEIADLSKLRELSLAGNLFSDEEMENWVEILPKALQSIDLRACDLSDLPDVLFDLPNLKEINLRGNSLEQVEGKDWEELVAKLPYLTTLHVDQGVKDNMPLFENRHLVVP